MWIRASTLFALAFLGGCAPQIFQRQTLVLDHAELDRFEIRYAEMQGCLWRRQVPVQYVLKRPGYTLDLEVSFGLDARAPSLYLELSPVDARATFAGLKSVPVEERLRGGPRYRIDPGPETAAFTIEIRRGENLLGSERLSLERRSCRGLSLGE